MKDYKLSQEACNKVEVLPDVGDSTSSIVSYELPVLESIQDENFLHSYSPYVRRIKIKLTDSWSNLANVIGFVLSSSGGPPGGALGTCEGLPNNPMLGYKLVIAVNNSLWASLIRLGSFRTA